MEKILDIVNITKTYPGVVALDSVSFDLYMGEIHCLVGENGAGKSTLIKILSGAIKPDCGNLNVFGKKYSFLDPSHAREIGFQTIYQESNLIETISVAENIYFGDERVNKAGFVSHSKTIRQAQELLDSQDMKVDASLLVSKLSVAEKQLVKIAKVLARNARILILDEPTASLNQTETSHLLKILNEIKNKNIGIIYISHRLGEVFEIADRISVLRDGKKIGTHFINEIDENSLICEMVGKKGDVFYKREKSLTGKVLMEVEGYKIRKDLSGISFELKKGEILGIAGMVGSGRSELVKGIFGVATIQKGGLAINGKKINIQNPCHAIDAGICLVPEDRHTEGLIPCRNVRENVTLPGLKKFRGLFINLSREAREVTKLISKLNIKTPSTEQIVQNLSGGNQQKIVLAKWLFAGAEIFIFDEPTRGIDVGTKQEIYKLMSELAKQGKAIIMISSDMPEIISLSDRVMVLRNGEVAGFLEKNEISEKNILSLAIGSSNGNNESN